MATYQFNCSLPTSQLDNDPGSGTIRSLTSDSTAAFLAKTATVIWRSDVKTLHELSSGTTLSYEVQYSLSSKLPSQVFLDWVERIVSLGQMQSNTLITALLFIYRLRMNNPCIVAIRGSEYRVLATALILANKYMDDDPVVNSAWHSRTHIPLEDLRIMEAEFLSNSGFALYFSVFEWNKWLKTVKSICNHYANALDPSLDLTPTSTDSWTGYYHPQQLAKLPPQTFTPVSIPRTGMEHPQREESPQIISPMRIVDNIGVTFACSASMNLKPQLDNPGLNHIQQLASIGRAEVANTAIGMKAWTSNNHPDISLPIPDEDFNVHGQWSPLDMPEQTGWRESELDARFPGADETVLHEQHPTISRLNISLLAQYNASVHAEPSVNGSSSYSFDQLDGLKDTAYTDNKDTSENRCGISHLETVSGGMVHESPCSSFESVWVNSPCKRFPEPVEPRHWNLSNGSYADNPVY